MAKSKEKIKARKLRKKGESIKKIANLLHVSVSTASLWCRDVELTDKQIENLRRRQTDPFYGKRLDYYLKKKKEFSSKLLNLKNEGIESIGSLSKREIFLIGVALYWGEGFKKDSLAGLATLDINIAKFFIFWLNMKKLWFEFIKGVWRENPIFFIVLGLCPALAVSISVNNALGMGLAVTFVLGCSNAIISMVRNFIPDKIRIPCFIVIIATFVTIVELTMKAYAPELSKALGIFVPLIE